MGMNKLNDTQYSDNNYIMTGNNIVINKLLATQNNLFLNLPKYHMTTVSLLIASL